MDLREFDIIRIDYWQCPFESGVPLLTMPNIPKPLHAVNPRNLMGQEEWDKQRMECYEKANGRCEICHSKCERFQAHELYSYNYESFTGVYKRPVALCDKCHRSIHSGRLVTMAKEGNVPPYYFFQIVEHTFSLISEYNKQHNTELRVYESFLQALKNPALKDEMLRLIKKYNIKFYKPIKPKRENWAKWKLVWNRKIIRTPYACENDWEKKMEKQKVKDYMRNGNLRENLNAKSL